MRMNDDFKSTDPVLPWFFHIRSNNDLVCELQIKMLAGVFGFRFGENGSARCELGNA